MHQSPVTLTTTSARRDPLTAEAALGQPHAPAESLYIHTPFCVHKCHYCDFYSFVDSRDQQAAFVDRLIDELQALAPHAARPLRTIFVGGGTPSLLRVELWVRILDALRGLFDLSFIRAGHGEFTVECNPESVSAELLAVLRAGGVDRVSVGAQSFNRKHLVTLERTHNPDNVAKAIALAREAGVPRSSVDLIYAIPGQTLADWSDDLDRAIALGTTHISCYNLTYEPNTPMTVRLKRGEFLPTDEDLEADMFALTGERLIAAGLERYEVSNYARPGHESLHNLVYWRSGSWLAAGPSASGHVHAAGVHAGGHRWKNAPNLGTYLESASGFAPIVDHESPDAARALRERVMMGIRLREGLPVEAIRSHAEAAKPGVWASIEKAVTQMRSEGWIAPADDSGVIRVSERGWLMVDWVAKQLMKAV